MAVSKEASSSAHHRRSSPNAAYYLAKCVLRGSVVLQVVQGRLRSPTSLDIVFGKETSIELVIIGDDGIVQSVCEQAVFGTIKDLAVLHWNDKFSTQNPQMAGKDILVVISDSGKLSFLRFCNEMHRFFPVTHVQLSSPGNSRHQLGRMLAVDSNAGLIAASAYESRLAIFSVSMSAGSNIIDKRIFYPPENELDTTSTRGVQRTSICGTIWGMCFVSKDLSQPSKKHNPVLAVLLTRRGATTNELLLLEWNIREHTVYVVSVFAEAGPLAYSIVGVPYSYGLVFLFRVGDVLLMDLRDASNPCCVYRTSLPAAVEEQNFIEESCRMHDGDDEGIFKVAASALLELGDMRVDNIKCDDPMSIDNDSVSVKSPSKYVCSWCWGPGNGENQRMVFCLDTGDFFMIEISFDSDGLKVNMSDPLYKSLPCKALLWVENGFLAALVEMGDGMVLQLENGKLVCRSPIQNIAPVLDMSVVDCHEEKHDQMFACCGMAPEGSLRIIRSGISVERLLSTAPIYQGITGTWTVRMKVVDSYHAFLVLSFIEETRVLSVGLSFTDVTDSVGFQPDVCTLACGLVGDGMLVQIHRSAVRLCLPTMVAHPEGISLSSPVHTSWFPDNLSISLGAVGNNLIIVATSNPWYLFILGVRSLSPFQCEIYEKQHVRLQNELSCISIPQKHFEQKQSTSRLNLVENNRSTALPIGVGIGSTFVIGTHKPSVEILCFLPDRGLRVLAIGAISLTNTMGTVISGCIPQDVRLVLVDRLYVLSGLRNGMLLRFEWPAASKMSSLESFSHRPSYDYSCLVNVDSAKKPNMTGLNSIGSHTPTVNSSEAKDNIPIFLQVVAIRRIGISPVFLVPLSYSLDADIIALSDRPWLLQTARHSLAYTSISFQPATHATPVCSDECPMGIIFVAENSLHLVEMVHYKRLNVQKFCISGTPRKVLYHNESRLLLVMRTDLSNDSYSSDICCIDPLSGSEISTFKFGHGETGKSMELVRVGNEQVLVVGTSLTSGPAIMPSGEAESTKGRLIVLCLDHVQNSDSGSMTFCSKAGSSSQRTSPFREIVGYAAEQLSSSSLCSSPDDTSCDGINLDESWELRLAYATAWPGMVLAVCPYLDRYFLASAGNAFYVCGFPNDSPQKVRRYAVGRTRFMIMSLTAQFTRIAVGDCRDGILFYSYREDTKRLEQLYGDPGQRLVADCILMDVDTAVVSDRKGSIAILSCSNHLEDNASPESNLTLSCAYYMGEIAMRIRKGPFSFKLPADDLLKGYEGPNIVSESLHNSIIATTLLGSIIIFIPLSREEYELLEAVQARLLVHPLTSPILGNDHNEFRSRENQDKNLNRVLFGQFKSLIRPFTRIWIKDFQCKIKFVSYRGV
ncbi:uncharacterized protein LOC131167852 isoform X2 [Malania oleifera]|uniref:uncharacterized protein LOC131167852 isoform X2 n=1 Tax=Malania oleifera TaxID=397392 RepID=UPI0025AEB89E|nr:uncharacterized protein LOC131167852 isoform X2 [Malania oleifera]